MLYIYMVTFTINIPPMLAYIPAPWILWVLERNDALYVSVGFLLSSSWHPVRSWQLCALESKSTAARGSATCLARAAMLNTSRSSCVAGSYLRRDSICCWEGWHGFAEDAIFDIFFLMWFHWSQVFFFCRELIQWASKVTKGELETAIGQFMHLIKSDRPKPSTCHVVVVFMAAHGRQPHTSEVPAILPSDVRFPEREEELVNLDPLLLVPLDSIKSEKLKVWLTIDACRENQEIVTWTGNQQSQLQRVHRRSETDFHILLACDRGRFANDAYSLAGVLIEALDDPWKDPSIIHRSWDLHRWRFQTLRNWHNHHLSLCPSC